MSVCNRLSVTKHSIEAIKRHSTLPHQLYVYDNHTNHKIDEHFEYFCRLYKSGEITQVVFNTRASTFNAFSKASSCNQFGLTHECDPNKNSYEFLLIMDNDIIVTPGYDKILKNAWDDVKKLGMKDIKIISQNPGGIIKRSKTNNQIGGYDAIIGKAGGSGFWSVRNNFFTDVGFLDLKQLVGLNKRHDINYWKKLERSSGGKPYILGVDTKLCIHVGGMAGSVCNTYTRNKGRGNVEEMIKFKDKEEQLDKLTFDQFYKAVYNDKGCISNW